MKILKTIFFVFVPIVIAFTLLLFVVHQDGYYFSFRNILTLFDRVVEPVQNYTDWLNTTLEWLFYHGLPLPSLLLGIIGYSVVFPILICGDLIWNLFGFTRELFNYATRMPENLPTYIFDSTTDVVPDLPSDWDTWLSSI